jgi:RNA polymerase sigma factor (sigma-70 family)
VIDASDVFRGPRSRLMRSIAPLRPGGNWITTAVAWQCNSLIEGAMYSVVVRSTNSGGISSRLQQDAGGKSSSDADYARFASVVLPHLDAAYNLAYWLTRNRTDAEDIVQDTSLRAFTAIRGFTGGSARAWTLCIVRIPPAPGSARTIRRKCLLSMICKRSKLRTPSLEDPEAGTPGDGAIAKTDAAQLCAAIAALPLPFRETLVLRDVEGLDYREIAEATVACFTDKDAVSKLKTPNVGNAQDMGAVARNAFL